MVFATMAEESRRNPETRESAQLSSENYLTIVFSKCLIIFLYFFIAVFWDLLISE